jgi:Mg2+-importing ATPase
VTAAAPPVVTPIPVPSAVVAASQRSTDEVLLDQGVNAAVGLPEDEAARRRTRWGPNVVASHHARPWAVLGHQLRSPLLGLLVVAAAVSFGVGEHSSALVIGAIVALSVGLGFINEYRAERAAQTLHSQVHHCATVLRGGRPHTVDVRDLVPGEVVSLRLGAVVPADLRLLEVVGLECAESVLTGESLPVEKSTAPVPAGTPLAELTSCALMGTVVHAGSARGVVVATGAGTELGTIAAGLSTRPVDTEFQLGLKRFSLLLVRVAGVLTTAVLVVNVVLGKPVLDAVLFSLAIAVGITPQLLPAVVSTSLAAGSRRMTARHVLVKRLVCIEDLGDLDLLLTDKTGTLTLGRIDYLRAVPVPGVGADEVLARGLQATESGADAGGNPLDDALWRAAPGTTPAAPLGVLPFDHERRMVSVLVRGAAGAVVLVTKGAPETVLERCTDVPVETRAALAAEFAAGNRVVAVATRSATGTTAPVPGDEHGLHLVGLLVFADPPKPGAAAALTRLAELGVTVKVVTGDNAVVAARVCRDLGLLTGDGEGVLQGGELDAMDDDALALALRTTVVLARVSPEHKARIVRVARGGEGGVAFLGDGVNDALALHAADVGISVDSATDVAKDAADVILLEKDLGVLADGVVEGRRIFANTMKYVLMGTSSNVGNMVSAAAASVFLGFLPMLPSQILLNNLLYDTSQLAIPTDGADPEQLRRPAHWDLAFIRKFMLFFGPLSSVFDLVTFAVMLWVFHSGPEQFRSGWFVESLATQTLVIFAIRTRRVPFFRSHPSLPLTLSALAVVAVGAAIPATPFARSLGFQPLPGTYFAALAGMVVGYLLLVELGKTVFYRAARAPTSTRRRFTHHHHLRRRAAYFSSTGPRPDPA